MVTLGGVGSVGGLGLPCKGFSQVGWSYLEAPTQVYTGYTVTEREWHWSGHDLN